MTRLRSVRLVRLALDDLAAQSIYPSNQAIFEATRKLDQPSGKGVSPDAYKPSRNKRVADMIRKARGRRSAIETPSFDAIANDISPVRGGRDLKRVFDRYCTQLTRANLARRLIAMEERNLILQSGQALYDERRLDLIEAEIRLKIVRMEIEHFQKILETMKKEVRESQSNEHPTNAQGKRRPPKI